MTTSTPESSDELRDLRRRAYGPDSGAGLDGDEIERLRELERRSRAAHSGPLAAPAAVHETAPEPEEPPASVAVPVTVAVDAVPPVDAGLVEASRQAQPPWWRRRSLWITATAGLAIGLAAAAGLGALRMPPPTEVLLPTDRSSDDLADAAGEPFFPWEPETIQHYGPWHAVDVWTVTRSDGTNCLLLTMTSEGAQQGAFVDARCAPAGLDPQYDLWIWEGMQSYTGTDLPAQSSVRFVARGGVVDVWVQPAGSSDA